MLKLTKTQEEFLIAKGINSNQIFDASGLRTGEYCQIMKANGYKVAIGVTPCRKGKHSLRDSSGNCLQCHPSSIGYEKNYRRDAFIYLAESKLGKLIKVGTTQSISTRIKSLNSQKYGSYSDWEIVESKKIAKDAGEIEKKIHADLHKFNTVRHYLKDGRTQATYELFECSAEVALNLLIKHTSAKEDSNKNFQEISGLISPRPRRIKRSWTDASREDRLAIKHKYAEVWLDEALEKISNNFLKKGFAVPKVRVLFGFTTAGHNTKRRLGNHQGECLSSGWTCDGTIIITVTPLVKRAIDALTVLGHELVHAIDNCENQHKKKFMEIAKALGFGRYGNDIFLSEQLHEEFIAIEEHLGKFPGINLNLVTGND